MINVRFGRNQLAILKLLANQEGVITLRQIQQELPNIPARRIEDALHLTRMLGPWVRESLVSNDAELMVDAWGYTITDRGRETLGLPTRASSLRAHVREVFAAHNAQWEDDPNIAYTGFSTPIGKPPGIMLIVVEIHDGLISEIDGVPIRYREQLKT